MTDTWKYSTIKHDEFRLFLLTELEPKVAFTLETFSIDDWPDYVALSYTWGTGPAAIECQCNGSPFFLSSTLCNALRNIFNDNDSIWLWVDAICINQKDEAEKASQVSQMSDVYVHAEKVIVWLGDMEHDSDIAFERLPSIADRFWAIQDQWSSKTARDIVDIGLPDISDPVWLAILYVYARPWFHRMWIVQEVVLASHVEYLCGREMIDSAYIINFAMAFARSGIGGNVGGSLAPKLGSRDSDLAASGIKMVMNIHYLRMEYEENRDDERWLRGVMEIMQSQSAFEKVDYVYGVRAMLPRFLQEKIKVDYSSQSKSNYWKVHARCFGLLLQQIDDLPRVLFPPHVKDERLPSWYPVWGSGLNSWALPNVGTGAGRPRPVDGTPMKRPLKFDLSDDCRQLMLKGASFDTIDSVLSLEVHEESETAAMDNIKDLMEKFFKATEFVSEFPEQYTRLPGVLVGDHNWRNKRSFSGYNDEDILKDLQAYLTRIITMLARSEHGTVPNIDEQGAWLGDDRFLRAYWNLGPAFIDGVMDGELFENETNNRVRDLTSELSQKLRIDEQKTLTGCGSLLDEQRTFAIV